MRAMLIATLVLVSAVMAQTPEAEQPKFPTQPQVTDTVEQVSIFRPKVVVHREIMIPKDPFLAGALSLPLPGTGQAYCGRWGRGLAFLAGSFGSLIIGAAVGGEKSEIAQPYKGIAAGTLLLTGFSVWAWSVVDGVHVAKEHNLRLVGTP